MKPNKINLLFALIILLLAAFRLLSQPAGGRFARVPDRERTRCNPFANDPDAPMAGRKLFLRHCAGCHGAQAEGTRRGPGLLEPAKQGSPGEIFWILTNGVVRRGMPAWSRLPEPQRWQIVTWLKSTR